MSESAPFRQDVKIQDHNQAGSLDNNVGVICYRWLHQLHPRYPPTTHTSMAPILAKMRKLSRSVPAGKLTTDLDCSNGYHSVPLHPADRHITTFLTGSEHCSRRLHPEINCITENICSLFNFLAISFNF